MLESRISNTNLQQVNIVSNLLYWNTNGFWDSQKIDHLFGPDIASYILKLKQPDPLLPGQIFWYVMGKQQVLVSILKKFLSITDYKILTTAFGEKFEKPKFINVTESFFET